MIFFKEKTLRGYYSEENIVSIFKIINESITINLKLSKKRINYFSLYFTNQRF